MHQHFYSSKEYQEDIFVNQNQLFQQSNQLKSVITTNVRKNASYNSYYTKWGKQQKLPILFSSFNP